MLALAATPGRLPSVTGALLAGGAEPNELLQPESPEPAALTGRLDDLGVRLLLPGDPRWPFRAAPPDPPCPWLFVIGPDPPSPERCVAIVGGRRASALRRATARSLAGGLAAAGICVVSGGAIGVDAAAHAGALDAGGATVVVLGCGLDVPYPRRNLELFRRVREAGGTLLTEHPPGAKPLAAHFLPRNRLIAALAGAVVVVEAADGSGSLSTARAAGSRGAGQVLAVPGAPWDPGAAGCNDLIRDGAALVRGLDDVLEALPRIQVEPVPGAASAGPDSGRTPWNGPRRSPGNGPRRSPGNGPRRTPGNGLPCRPLPEGATSAARRVIDALGDGRLMSVAAIAGATGLEPNRVVGALLELELAGLVRRSASGAEAIAIPLDPASRGPPRRPDRRGGSAILRQVKA
jgi:DNA processing protein